MEDYRDNLIDRMIDEYANLFYCEQEKEYAEERLERRV